MAEETQAQSPVVAQLRLVLSPGVQQDWPQGVRLWLLVVQKRCWEAHGRLVAVAVAHQEDLVDLVAEAGRLVVGHQEADFHPAAHRGHSLVERETPARPAHQEHLPALLWVEEHRLAGVPRLVMER